MIEENRAAVQAWRMLPAWLRNMEAAATGTNGTPRARAEAREALCSVPFASLAGDARLDIGERDYIRGLAGRVAAGLFRAPTDRPCGR